MILKRTSQTLGWCCLLLMAASCGLTEFSGGKLSKHKSEYIVPLFKSSLTVESISKLANLSNDRDVTSNDLRDAGLLSDGPTIPSIPKLNSKRIGPLLMEDTGDTYIRAKSDTAIIRAIFKNNFPITVGKGTRLVFKNIPGPNNPAKDTTEVFSDTLKRDIKPGGVDSVDIVRTNLFGWIYNDFNLYIENFNTPGDASISFPFPETVQANVFLKVIVLKLNIAELSQNKGYVLSEVSKIDLSDEGDLVVDSAGFILFINNQFPSDYVIQASFLDVDSNVIETFFPGKGIEISTPGLNWGDIGPDGNAGGSVIASTVKERRFTATWTVEKYKVIKEKARFLKTYAYLRTPSEFSTPSSKALFLKHDDQIGIQMTAGFRTKIDLE